MRSKPLSCVFYLLTVFALPTFGDVWTYNVPGGARYSSPDYKVTVESGGRSEPSFVYYSFGPDTSIRYSKSLKPGKSVIKKNHFINSHSTAIFSFKGSVTVRVTISNNAKHITLPLTSARILPTSYNIPCTIENGNTIVFTLDRPEKVAIIANYDEAWKLFEDKAEGHVSIQNHDCDYQAECMRPDFHGEEIRYSLSEGYRNPLFVMALPPEQNLPDRNSHETLIVNPGDSITQSQMDQFKTIWFTPGVHDLSRMGTSPFYQTMINGGQTVYLEGGSYVMARFKKNDTTGTGNAAIVGRGVISGIRHKWIVDGLEGSQVINIDSIVGVSITDRACFCIRGGHYIEDVATLGPWHGNTDGPDFLDNCILRNCFLMAGDDNLKLNNNTHAKHIVIWQTENAHPIMVKEMRNNVKFSDCIVEDVDIIAYFHEPSAWNSSWAQISHAAIACVNGRNIQVNNFIFRDIRIESPYLYRVFSFYNMDSNQPYAAGWFRSDPSSESSHTRINGVTFENITVNSPVILFRSLLGSAYENSMSDIRFINLNINGTVVTEKNKDDFFEIEYDKINGLVFQEK